MAIFEIVGSKNPAVTHGREKKFIQEAGDTPNADIEYEEGYLDKDGNFVSLGVNHTHYQDTPEVAEVKDGDGNVTTPYQAATTAYTDLINAMKASTDQSPIEIAATSVSTKMQDLKSELEKGKI